MNWWPLFDETLVVMLAIGSVVVFLLVLLPPALLLDWCLKNTRNGSPFRNHLTVAGYLFIFFFGFLLLVGFVHRGNARQTLLGALVNSQLGWAYFILIELGIAYLAELGLRRLGIGLCYPPRPWWDDPNPAAVWTPIVDDGELPPESTFGIEFKNDDKTKPGFLISILRNCLGLSLEQAYQEVLLLQEQGSRVVGKMSRTNADALIQHIQAEVARRRFPQKCQVVPHSPATDVPQWHDPDPVEAWIPAEDDKGLAPGAAYAIEFQNDNKTQMVFVLSMFVHCFGMNVRDAHREMMAIHEQGSRVVGSMSQRNAEALAQHIHGEAAKRGFPVQCKAVLAPSRSGL